MPILDIEALLKDMLSAMENSAKNDWSKIKGAATQAVEEHKEALEELAKQRLDNEIDDTFLQNRLKVEKLLLEQEIEVEKILTQAALQNAINAAIDVFNAAINKAISSIP